MPWKSASKPAGKVFEIGIPFRYKWELKGMVSLSISFVSILLDATTPENYNFYYLATKEVFNNLIWKDDMVIRLTSEPLLLMPGVNK